MNLKWTMDFWLCFWLALISVTHVTATSRCVTENGTLCVKNKYFKNLLDYYCSGNYENLHTIHLVQNNLSFLEARTFQGVSNLKHLLIVHNLLESLDSNLFSNLKELISLDLSYNKLKSFTNEHLFNSQSKLMVLRLQYNEIIILDSRMLVPLQSLKELNLTNNPFYCDCKLSNAVKWCAERNLTTGAKCNNGLLWTEFKYENCTSYYKEESFPITCIMTGIGIIAVIIVCIVAEVLVYFLRRTRPRDTSDSHNATCEDTSASHCFRYEIISDNRQTLQAPQYFTGTLSCNQTDLNPSQEYTEVIKEPSELKDTEKYSNDATVNGVSMATDDSTLYAEPFQHWTNEASVTYAEPYHQITAIATTRNKERMEEISVENELYSQNYN